MTYREPAPTTTHAILRTLVAGLLVVIGGMAPALCYQLLASSSSTAASPWVVTPNTSTHVPGNAVDVGPFDATAWLSEHGAEYGLCQIYSNDPWHYALRPIAVDHGCPPMYADPTRDPRMQQ